MLLTVFLFITACLPRGPVAPWETAPDRPGTSVTLAPPAVNRAADLPSPIVTSTSRAPTPPPAPASPEGYVDLSIAALEDRSYGGGELRVLDTLPGTGSFTRQLFVYPSEGLRIHGFLNRPPGNGPFPVVIALHGYIDPEDYETLDYTSRYADALAEAGFFVLHPNLRGYPPSDEGSNLFRVGMALDVLNLIAIVRDQAGRPGPLEGADGEAIGLWGHSMGGGIALRVVTVSPHVDGAVLYGSMSGDEVRNFTKILEWSEGTRGLEELAVPESVVAQISPINHLHLIESPLSVHHGEADELVPVGWSIELCERLTALGAQIDCYTYPGQPHTFYGDADQLFIDRTVDFFETHLPAS